MKINTIIATAATLMGSALCQAQEVDKKQKQFEKLDADKNGSLSLEEWSAGKNKAPKQKKLEAEEAE